MTVCMETSILWELLQNFTEVNFTGVYGGYGAYFEEGLAAYGGIGDDGNITDFGTVGPYTTLDEAAENALLPSGVPSNDYLQNHFKDKWETWMNDYYKKKAMEQDDTLTSEERKQQDDPFWPMKLIGFGKGSKGDLPPPYAYQPSNDEGFPSLCFQSIHKGRYRGIKCDPGPRYGFVGGIKICVAFYYRGCGGNENNFKDKKNCEVTCTKIPEAGCNPKTKNKLDHVVIDYSLL